MLAVQIEAAAQQHGPETPRLYATVAHGMLKIDRGVQDGRYRAGNGVAQAVSPAVPDACASARASKGAAE
jgi:hypothetical protein